ncbi:hypothetical protein ABT096_36590 [Streptomyces sp. NPDC002561]|uniref:hypothetical protein n=1 Tax=Streptomyces sp. NPDC002561 TaxID=3154418 RepID=UPI00332B7E37
MPQQGSATAPVLMLVQIATLQAGSAVAKEAYASAGPSTPAGMRLFFSAAILLLPVRPSLRKVTAVQ